MRTLIDPGGKGRANRHPILITGFGCSLCAPAKIGGMF
jgi:hypothetical protein